MQEITNSIVRLFPDFEKKINFLLRTDENFQDLCNDYVLCTIKVVEMKKAINHYETKMEEYLDLKGNLEQEIFQFVNKD
jgi:hypothetical protein